MKKFIFYVLFLSMMPFCVNGQEAFQHKNPQDAGKYAFSVLKKLPHASSEEFTSRFITIKELKEFATKLTDSADLRIKERIAEMTMETYQKMIDEEYDELIAKGKEHSIDWKSIDYVDFDYKERTNGSVQGLTGSLLFKHNEVVYETKMEAILIDETYAVMIVRSLRKDGE